MNPTDVKLTSDEIEARRQEVADLFELTFCEEVKELYPYPIEMEWEAFNSGEMVFSFTTKPLKWIYPVDTTIYPNGLSMLFQFDGLDFYTGGNCPNDVVVHFAKSCAVGFLRPFNTPTWVIRYYDNQDEFYADNPHLKETITTCNT
jgi:hypothetical protein